MQIVIEVPDEIYSRIELMDDEKALPYSLRKAYLLIIICAITNGKILPKGHGDLIDRSKIKWFGCDIIRNCHDDCSSCCYAGCYHDDVMSLPKIVSADTEETDATNNVNFDG